MGKLGGSTISKNPSNPEQARSTGHSGGGLLAASCCGYHLEQHQGLMEGWRLCVSLHISFSEPSPAGGVTVPAFSVKRC